jgi:hypothetical protein
MMEAIQEVPAMVAVAQLIPDDPEEKASVLKVLREHPELQEFITRTLQKAEEMFPEVRVELDTVRYDEWDPPIRLRLYLTQPWEQYRTASDEFIHWFANDPGFDIDTILVMPLWAGPIESYSR